MAGIEPMLAYHILAYPFSVGGSLLAHVKVAFLTVMLEPPPEKQRTQRVRHSEVMGLRVSSRLWR